jgi:hypothetical protein
MELLKKHWDTNQATTQRPEITLAVLYQEANDLEKAEELMVTASEFGTENAINQIMATRWALENGKLKLAKNASTKQSRHDRILKPSYFRHSLPATKKTRELPNPSWNQRISNHRPTLESFWNSPLR